MNQILGIYDGNTVEIRRQFCHYDKKNDIESSAIGEVFNSYQLQKKLNNRDQNNKSDNLAEFLLDAYNTWETQCPNELSGRFSLGIYDPHKKIIFIARDPVGLKPLYYCSYNGKFAYSSELKSLINLNWVPKDIDLNALNFYFAYRFIPAEMTIYKHIRKLSAGSSMIYQLTGNSYKKWNYWKVPDPEPNSEDENSTIEKLKEIINDSLLMRIKGENPPGIFLSGGLDSSMLVALMSRHISQPIKTFSVGFDIKKYNEIPYSRIISEYFNTQHREIFVTPDFDVVKESINLFDEPFADPSLIPNYYAAKLASENNTKSIITGDGADGLFLGLRTHLLSKQVSDQRGTYTSILKSITNKFSGIIPPEAKWKIFLQDLTAEEFFQKRCLVFNADIRKKLLKPWIREELGGNFYEPENAIFKNLNQYSGSFMDKMGYATLKADSDDIFFKSDRFGSKFSINIRAPFLDKRLVEFVFKSVNSNMKIRGNTTKYILKKYARQLLPPELPVERKQGFNPPFSEWLRNEWWNQTREILMNGNETYLDNKYIEKLLKYHKNGIFNEGRMIFSLLCFKLWEQRYRLN